MAFFSLSLLRNWFSRPARAVRPGRRPGCRPRLEALEERTLLSPGDLDPTFGSGGLVTTPPPNPTYSLGATRVVVQADSRILVAAREGYFKGVPPPVLLRYNNDGSLDSSFGSNGMVFVSLSVLSDSFCMALQTDGRIIVASFGYGALILARYTSDGRLDNSFGSGGTVRTSFPGYGVVPSSVAVQPDGSIVLGGLAYDSTSTSFSLARYAANGSLDRSFGNQGLVVTAFPGQSYAAATGMTLQEDGSIVLVGTTSLMQYGNPKQIALARYDHDGHLDPSFGMDGLVTTAFPGFSNASAGNDVVVQSDGSLLLAGSAWNDTGGDQFALARYASDGSLDDSFGSGGLVTTDFPGFLRADGYGLVIQSNGRILVAGGTFLTGGYQQFALARYASDGSLDGSFGTDGRVPTSFFGTQSYAVAADVTVQPDGRIVAAGTAGGRNALARYDGGGVAATHFAISAPAAVTAGQGFSYTVTALDAYGQVATDYTGTVTLTSTDPAAAVLGSHTFVASDAGLYTFSGGILFTAGPQAVFADDGNLSGQADLPVDPGVAVALVLSGPDQATAGVPVVVTVTAVDAWGNVATGYTGTVWLSATDPDANLPDAWDFSADDAGTHLFTVTLNTPGPVRLTAHDTDAGWSADLDLIVV